MEDEDLKKKKKKKKKKKWYDDRMNNNNNKKDTLCQSAELFIMRSNVGSRVEWSGVEWK